MTAWLSISLDDYEAHMALPEIAQSQALASEVGALVERYRPASFALLGCAGGNGLDRIDPAVTRRVVAVDINPAFVLTAQQRFGARFESFEPHVCDVSAGTSAPFEPVDVVFAGLLFEYVPLLPALGFIRSALVAGGILGAVLQRPCDSMPEVSPSPYRSLECLASEMRLVAPEELTAAASRVGLVTLASRDSRMPNGKILATIVFARRP